MISNAFVGARLTMSASPVNSASSLDWTSGTICMITFWIFGGPLQYPLKAFSVICCLGSHCTKLYRPAPSCACPSNRYACLELFHHGFPHSSDSRYLRRQAEPAAIVWGRREYQGSYAKCIDPQLGIRQQRGMWMRRSVFCWTLGISLRL